MGAKIVEFGREKGREQKRKRKKEKRSWRRPEGVKATMGVARLIPSNPQTLTPVHTFTLTLNPMHKRLFAYSQDNTFLPAAPFSQAKAIDLPYD